MGVMLGLLLLISGPSALSEGPVFPGSVGWDRAPWRKGLHWRRDASQPQVKLILKLVLSLWSSDNLQEKPMKCLMESSYPATHPHPAYQNRIFRGEAWRSAFENLQGILMHIDFLWKNARPLGDPVPRGPRGQALHSLNYERMLPILSSSDPGHSVAGTCTRLPCHWGMTESGLWALRGELESVWRGEAGPDREADSLGFTKGTRLHRPWELRIS